jgi:3-oxoacyl-[acyl-carrier protein] reductase
VNILATSSTASPLAVVTGGTKGLGLGFTQRLLDLGYRVVALYRGDESAADEADKVIAGQGEVVRADVSDPDQVASLRHRILAEHGVPAVLVNNAGRNIDRPFLQLTTRDWEQVVATNLSGPFYLSREFAPHMINAGGGSIVNIGATTAIRPRRNGANYCASKAGLLHLTKCLALELAPVIRVNCLIPGMIDTEEMRTRYRYREEPYRQSLLAEIPQGRIGTPDEMSDALEFLIGPQSRYITGQKLIVDGGQFMW